MIEILETEALGVEIEKPELVYNKPESASFDDIIYNRSMLYNAVDTSYIINDDGYLNSINYFKQENIPLNPISYAMLDPDSGANQNKLIDNNYYGNKDRYTDIFGGQNYQDNNDYMIDHLTGIGWYLPIFFTPGGTAFTDYISTVIPSWERAGYSDWKVPTAKALQSIITISSGFFSNSIPEYYSQQMTRRIITCSYKSPSFLLEMHPAGDFIAVSSSGNFNNKSFFIMRKHF